MASRTVATLALGGLVACAPEAAAPPSAAGAPDQHHHHHDGGADHHHHGGPMVHRFENAAQWAKDFDDPARDAWQRPTDVIAALQITPGMTVADLGAGTGYFLPHLARAAGPKGKVIALDVEPDMVRYMKERAAREGLANVEARVVPFDDPALPAGSVDRILIVDTWHHIDGREVYARKLRDALAPGGAVFVVDFKKDAHRGPPPEHRLAPEQIIDELRRGGLTAELVPSPLPEQYIVAGWRR